MATQSSHFLGIHSNAAEYIYIFQSISLSVGKRARLLSVLESKDRPFVYGFSIVSAEDLSLSLLSREIQVADCNTALLAQNLQSSDAGGS